MSTPPPPAVIVHIPHASLRVPGEVAAAMLLTPAELQHELLVMTDRYTDVLFSLQASLTTTVAFPVSRLVVDPERFTDDEREPMARKGMGIVHERIAAGRHLRHRPSAHERHRLLVRFYEPHHTARGGRDAARLARTPTRPAASMRCGPSRAPTSATRVRSLSPWPTCG